jgi:hypothetical protein
MCARRDGCMDQPRADYFRANASLNLNRVESQFQLVYHVVLKVIMPSRPFSLNFRIAISSSEADVSILWTQTAKMLPSSVLHPRS